MPPGSSSAENLQAAAGLATNAFLAFSLFYTTYYLQSTYRTSGDFAKLAVANVINNGVAVAMLVFVWMFRYYGLCVRALLGAAAGLVVLYHWRPVRVGPRWNFGHLWHLTKIGFPIFCAGQLYGWWVVLDQTLVLYFTGDRGLGLYAMVILACGTMDLLPGALSQVVYPRAVEQFGRTESLRAALKITIKPMLATAVGMVPLILVAEILIGPVVSRLLPRYVGAIPAIRWSLWISLMSSFGPLDHGFILAKRQTLLAIATVVGMLAYLAALWVLLKMPGDTLIAFPQAMLVGRAVYIAMHCVFLYYLIRVRRARAQG